MANGLFHISEKVRKSKHKILEKISISEKVRNQNMKV